MSQKDWEALLYATKHITALTNYLCCCRAKTQQDMHPLFLVSLHARRSFSPYVGVLMQHIDFVSVLEAPVNSLPQPLLSLNPPQQPLSIQIKGWQKSARRHFALEYEIKSPLGVQ